MNYKKALLLTLTMLFTQSSYSSEYVRTVASWLYSKKTPQTCPHTPEVSPDLPTRTIEPIKKSNYSSLSDTDENKMKKRMAVILQQEKVAQEKDCAAFHRSIAARAIEIRQEEIAQKEAWAAFSIQYHEEKREMGYSFFHSDSTDFHPEATSVEQPIAAQQSPQNKEELPQKQLLEQEQARINAKQRTKYLKEFNAGKKQAAKKNTQLKRAKHKPI